MSPTYESLPDNLPIPIDDGACDHLLGMQLPNFVLDSTTRDKINLAEVGGRLVIYCYPMTGVPGIPLPDGWDDIPGARGCTPQNIAYRDRYQEILKLGAKVFGISTQILPHQYEMAIRLNMPFPILSDLALKFCRTMRIPTFISDDFVRMKRVTLIAIDGTIEAVHYPVFPSNSDPQWVIDYLTANH